MVLRELQLEIVNQPTDTTCGPTCLHALYDYYDRPLPLDQIIAEIPALELGGTLAVHLANHAMRRGFSATIYTYNLQIFDPTWFHPNPQPLAEKLKAQAAAKPEPKLKLATQAYLDFLDLGGQVKYEDLTPPMIRKILEQDHPILTGLSSTFLYRSQREIEATCADDDIAGYPCGHFVVLCGYHRQDKTVKVADPSSPNPFSPSPYYFIPINRLVGAIYLGVLTYDANMLILQPRR